MNKGLLLALVGLLAACGPKRFAVEDHGIRASADVELVARGEYLFNGAAHCSACHTPTEVGASINKGDRPSPVGGHVWKMGPLATLRAPNITPHPETGVGNWSDADLARVLRDGVRPDGTISTFMRIAMGDLADDDIQALVSYIRTLEPANNSVPRSELHLLGKMLLGGMEPRPSNVHLAKAPAMSPPSLERGRYLAHGPAACFGCHTESDGFAPKKGVDFAGGAEMESEFEDEKKVYNPPNLTPSKTGIAGTWTEQNFLDRFKQGRIHRGSPMPWGNYQNLTEDDVRSLWIYLRSVPAHENVRPAPVVEKT